MTYKHIITKGVTAAVCAVATLSFVLSCTKEQVSEAERSSVVTFSIPGVNSGSITTKASLDDITNALVATQPTGTPTLTIRSTADNSVSYTAYEKAQRSFVYCAGPMFSFILTKVPREGVGRGESPSNVGF